MKQQSARLDGRSFRLPLLALLTGSLMWGCLPLPILDANGVVRGTALDPSNRMHVVIENEGGIQYGVVNGLWLNPEPVTAAGTLGEGGYPVGAGRGVLAVDPAGRPHVLFYSNGATGLPALYGDLVHSWKESGAWESEVIGTVEDCWASAQPSIAIDDSGDVHVTYSNMDCDSGDIEIRYAKKQAGLWGEEVIDTVVGLSLWMYPVLISRIALGPDQEPVIAAGIGGWNFEPHCSDAAVRVLQPAEGGGWEVEEIFLFVDPCEYQSESAKLPDLSLAVGPSGEKAVGFIIQTSFWSYVSLSYWIMVHTGSDWIEDRLCSQFGGEFGDPLDCQAQDIAFDPAGRLHAMFTRERFHGPPDYSPVVDQSISLARRTETGWDEETLWDNTLYGVAAEYEYLPQLLFTSASQAKILYNNGSTLMLLTK